MVERKEVAWRFFWEKRMRLWKKDMRKFIKSKGEELKSVYMRVES